MVDDPSIVLTVLLRMKKSSTERSVSLLNMTGLYGMTCERQSLGEKEFERLCT